MKPTRDLGPGEISSALIRIIDDPTWVSPSTGSTDRTVASMSQDAKLFSKGKVAELRYASTLPLTLLGPQGRAALTKMRFVHSPYRAELASDKKDKGFVRRKQTLKKVVANMTMVRSLV